MYSKDVPVGEFVVQAMTEFRGLNDEPLFRRVRVMAVHNVTVENAKHMADTLRGNNPTANLIPRITVWL